MAASPEEKEQRQLATDARGLVKRVYDRGVEAGVRMGRKEGLEAAKREATIDSHAEQLEASAGWINDEDGRAALTEAASILRDLQARERGDEEEEPAELEPGESQTLERQPSDG